ncbi:hypothetical protein J2S09_004434 [Bacillus fengqiuensis]|nr:hypothetical protein [Bacillus fengqiuensis]
MIVEKAFDINDWVVLVSIMVIWAIFCRLPKTFPRQTTVLIMLYGLTFASVLDNSFGAKAFDFYDIMDGPVYTVMDAFVYFLYPPFAYFFIYIYHLLKIKSRGIVLYIFLWSLLSILVESIYENTHVFTYKNGYSLFYSFCIYLTVQSGLLIFFRAINEKEK